MKPASQLTLATPARLQEGHDWPGLQVVGKNGQSQENGDTGEIVVTASERGMTPVIPPKSNRREVRDYDRELYMLRHLVGNGFLRFKQLRGVSTRYDKKAKSFLSICQLEAVTLRNKLL